MNIQELAARSPTWCPGCGNYGIWASLKNTLVKLGWSVDQFVIVYGVGCSGNMTDFITSHGFHSLHGRALANAAGIKLANHHLKVICMVGDGDCYGEGGNHLLHSVRGNHDLTVFVHDNRVYGLTTGQVAPTAAKGYVSKSTPQGVIENPVNALSLAISHGASFVAQGFAGDLPHLSQVVEKALLHKGFSLVNVLQPCVTFNKINTYQFFRDRVYKLETENHNPESQEQALNQVLFANDRIPIGVLYQNDRPAYHEQVVELKTEVLVKQPVIVQDLSAIYQEYA